VSYRNHRPMILGLCLAVALGLFAFTAASALALGNWRIEGANINATKEIEAEKDSNGFKFLAPGLNLEVFCEGFAIDDGLIFAGVKAGEGSAKLLFTACKANQLTPLTELSCTVANITAEAKFYLALHKSKNYLFFEPLAGGEFTKIKFSGTKCTLPAEYVLAGTLVLQDSLSGDFATELIKHLIEESPTAFKGQVEEGVILPDYFLTIGKSPTFLDGSAWLKLKAPENNKNWSGLV
jgi:hypothetical protein